VGRLPDKAAHRVSGDEAERQGGLAIPRVAGRAAAVGEIARVLKPGGRVAILLTADSVAADAEPSWRPDGRKLVFRRDLDPVEGEVDYDLFTMEADGTRQRNLTRWPGIQG
jgi:Tol biopolymer transport system component